jgi:hypothetical protein
MYIYIFFIPLYFALHVSGANCTHPQEHKLQPTTIGVEQVLAGAPSVSQPAPAPRDLHTITITHTYGCTLQFVLLRIGANSTRNM